MKKIVVLAGDGIGPEIMTSALQIVKACLPSNPYFSFESYAFGGQAIEQYGTPLPKTLQACQQADAILLRSHWGSQVGKMQLIHRKKVYWTCGARLIFMPTFAPSK